MFANDAPGEIRAERDVAGLVLLDIAQTGAQPRENAPRIEAFVERLVPDLGEHTLDDLVIDDRGAELGPRRMVGQQRAEHARHLLLHNRRLLAGRTRHRFRADLSGQHLEQPALEELEVGRFLVHLLREVHLLVHAPALAAERLLQWREVVRDRPLSVEKPENLAEQYPLFGDSQRAPVGRVLREVDTVRIPLQLPAFAQFAQGLRFKVERHGRRAS